MRKSLPGQKSVSPSLVCMGRVGGKCPGRGPESVVFGGNKPTTPVARSQGVTASPKIVILAAQAEEKCFFPLTFSIFSASL